MLLAESDSCYCPLRELEASEKEVEKNKIKNNI